MTESNSASAQLSTINYQLSTKNTVHIWSVYLDPTPERVAEMAAILPDYETERASRFYFEEHRRRYKVAHGALRTILGRYLSADPHTLHFDHGPKGKPQLADPNHQHLAFNLSHSGELALVGLTLKPAIGVDVEELRPLRDMLNLAKHTFAPSEYETLNALPSDQHIEGFFNCWTRKEAYIKAIGLGLSQPLDEFHVSLRPAEPARLLWALDQPDAQERWTFDSYTPFPGYLGAVAVEGEISDLQFLTFDF